MKHFQMVLFLFQYMDPDTLNYIVVMHRAFYDSLRNKFENLWAISRQLEAIHKLNLVVKYLMKCGNESG